MPEAGGCRLGEPPPREGAVFQSRAGLGNFGSVVLGARELAEPQGEQGEGLESSSWAMERGAVVGGISWEM